jgi:serine/threonine-protein kinase
MKKNYTINISIEKFWTIILPVAFISIFFGGIAGIFVVDRIIIPNLPGIANRGVIKVPDIINMDSQKARELLYGIGLRLHVQGSEYDNSLMRDVIISQQPAADTIVKKGRHVFVVVSRGPEIDTVPDVRNLTELKGKNILRKAGFGNINITRAYSDKTLKDNIINTNPKRNLLISREAPIEVTVSRGPRPTHAKVPNVIGDILSEAKKKIEDNGLKIGKISYKVTSKSRPGSIISQSASPGNNAPLESAINLVVAANK